MIKILFFASYREALGQSEFTLAVEQAPVNLATLKQLLIGQHGQAWRQVLESKNLVQAINQTVSDNNQLVNDGDEVAFFPPVTGG
ncbi:MAG: molybdopterin synthase sulfur carrier subunit [Pseudohongiellaceae bacterium]|jgi:molybdopterin synthase sulfur carrier subunit